jgi:hypothetical protein
MTDVAAGGNGARGPSCLGDGPDSCFIMAGFFPPDVFDLLWYTQERTISTAIIILLIIVLPLLLLLVLLGLGLLLIITIR